MMRMMPGHHADDADEASDTGSLGIDADAPQAMPEAVPGHPPGHPIDHVSVHNAEPVSNTTHLQQNSDQQLRPEVLLGDSLRDYIVEMVEECLRHKPEGIDPEGYFGNVLEPLFRYIASELIERRPEDPVEFVQIWVDREMNVLPGASELPRELLAPLPCLKAWCERQLSFTAKQRPALEALQAEVASLRLQMEMLKEGLSGSVVGQQMLAAMGAGDQAALNALLGAAGLAGPRTDALACNSDPLPQDSIECFSVAAEDCLQASPSAMEAEAVETMGEVLKSLRLQGVMSASAAFQHFQPDQDGCISSSHMLNEITNLQIEPQRAGHLVSRLTQRGTDTIDYKSFRGKISGFLATSRDFHSSLAADEFNAIMNRIQAKLQQQGLTMQEAFVELCDVNTTTALECTVFMQGLRSLQLGLSGKEVAQVFNAISAGSNPNSPNDDPVPAGVNSVSLQTFEAAMQRGARQNRLKEWANTSFARLREALEVTAISRTLRHYAEQPDCALMHYSGFTTLGSEADLSFSSVDIGKLWCVLDKMDGVEEPAVSIEELLRWMVPQGKVPVASHPT